MSEEQNTQLINIVRAQDARIDYNFNTLVQTTIVVEYLLEKLQQLNPDIPWEDEFAAFQEERLKELDAIAQEAKKKMEEEVSGTPDLDSINL